MNWKEILVNAGLPIVEMEEEQLEDAELNKYFASHPDNYKKIIPTAHAVLKDLQPVVANSKIASGLLQGLIAGIEDSAKENGVAL